MTEMEKRLSEIYARAREPAPEYGSADHRYWLNQIAKARMDAVEALPDIIAELRRADR